MKKVITKMFTSLGAIPKDKWEHFACGMVVASFCALTLHWQMVVPVASAVALGLLKEIWDEVGDSEFDFGDWLATALGGLLINAFAWVGMLV